LKYDTHSGRHLSPFGVLKILHSRGSLSSAPGRAVQSVPEQVPGGCVIGGCVIGGCVAGACVVTCVDSASSRSLTLWLGLVATRAARNIFNTMV